MKRHVFFLMLALAGLTQTLHAQAEITFEKDTHNFGTFSEEQPQVAVFTFTNTGNEPLVITQAFSSCGCTVPDYTQTPVQPGQKGMVKVTYNGAGKFAGEFKKPVTIVSNAKTKTVRIFIEGIMEPAKKK